MNVLFLRVSSSAITRLNCALVVLPEPGEHFFGKVFVNMAFALDVLNGRCIFSFGMVILIG